MKLRSALLAATAMAMPLAAHAQMSLPSLSGFYVGAGAGANFIVPQENINSFAAAPGVPFVNTNATIKSNPGPVALGYIGYLLPFGLAVELEGDYRSNGWYGLKNTTIPLGASGTEKKYGPMVNLKYDLSPYFAGMGIPFAPYIGIGVGYQWVNWPNNTFYTPTNSVNTHFDATKGAFAYQAILGGAYNIAAVPGLALTLEYRFMGILSRTYTGLERIAGPPVAFHTATLMTGQDFNQSVLVGFRYTFGVTPPPPPPAPVAAPAPAPARSYLVFFDWDKATLTDRAREIIREAATASTHVSYTQIIVNGYTDTSGTFRYNMGLSIRRARAVAGELVRDGVPENVISIHGFGETHLLVPTGPGVREPQNRRVEIIIR